jgi:adenylylsulfate kinase
MKKNKKKGTVFWITGLPGSGKTGIAKKLSKKISSIYGPTLCINGDDLRRIFGLKGYTRRDRILIAKKYIKFLSYLTNQKINVVFAVVGLFHEIHKINRKKFSNYFEIFIKSNLKDLRKRKDKSFYKKKTKNVYGQDIKPEFPKRPSIVIINNFKKSLNQLSNELFNKIKNYDK